MLTARWLTNNVSNKVFILSKATLHRLKHRDNHFCGSDQGVCIGLRYLLATLGLNSADEGLHLQQVDSFLSAPPMFYASERNLGAPL